MCNHQFVGAGEPGESHVHLIGADTATRAELGPFLLARLGGFISHTSIEGFRSGVSGRGWGAAILSGGRGRQEELAQAIARLRVSHPAFRAVVLADHPSACAVIQALRAGVADYFEVPFQPAAVSASAAAALEEARRGHAEWAARAEAGRRLEGLTPRECDVLALLVDGNTSKQIARRLSLSHRTVEYFRARVFAKTGADNVAELVLLHAAAARPRPVMAGIAAAPAQLGSAAIT